MRRTNFKPLCEVKESLNTARIILLCIFYNMTLTFHTFSIQI